jgi:hypothetical protein
VADDGEWNQKNAALSEVTAQKEYGVTRDFVIGGIRAGKLEWREGSMHGNPYLRVLRSQLVAYIVAELGSDYLSNAKATAELRATVTAIRGLKRKLTALEKRKAALEAALENGRAAESAAVTPPAIPS